jgi:hypothetical protein
MADRSNAGLSRRDVLRVGVLLMPIAVMAPRGRAGAQQKMKKAQVQYQETPKGKQECSNCLHFVAPDQCKLVEGKINPKGWCSLYAPKPA